ncbi:SDR family NAD(P)-dependent oxidoreductase [Myxococcus stipitatus]|uniref:SDR family NAD(P)-dependent oxidoreductase n=1 Tax=Myxococcus stipitatus TaxID=83455 RepID=UPI001F44C7DF|nr:SDR family NAD(P)-dependent oxidoreductase [Myxococcus stipitatus]MCE9673135.1 SDR family NAD(P)-dependent oxidoreductase [Myxococcus stipitatus]
MNERPVALITGASSGFGAVTAARFREHGFQVFGTRRAGGDGLLALDVDSDDSVRACIDALLREVGRIDVLVNNAGRAMVGACEETSATEARALFETNVFGVMRVTNAVLPSMRARGAGRIVNVGSVSGFVGVPFHGAYAASKHALAGYTEALRVELAPLGVRVALVEPSAHRTGIQMVRPRDTMPLYDEGRERVESIIRGQIETGDDPARVSDAILRAATEREPASRYRVGAKAVFAAVARRFLPMGAFERVLEHEFGPR